MKVKRIAFFSLYNFTKKTISIDFLSDIIFTIRKPISDFNNLYSNKVKLYLAEHFAYENYFLL